uniref:Uncharacterized protein n=1 Tax=Rhizophora mucronata TaxID=61149 RepID=A0A2P2MHA3_RHIMU
MSFLLIFIHILIISKTRLSSSVFSSFQTVDIVLMLPNACACLHPFLGGGP